MAAFGKTLKSKNRTAQSSELLAKILAHNLAVLIPEMHEAGISPAFCTPNQEAATQMAPKLI